MAERRSLDHFVIATKDVEVAGTQYERLGFQVMPQMRHVEIGTCNRVFQLHDTYVELLGDIDRAPAHLRQKVVDRFNCGEGLTLVSLTSADLPGDREILAAAGLKPEPIINARRKVRMPEGHFDETDSRCVYTWNAQPSMSLFLSQHHKPEVIWSEAYQRHPNTATRITKLTYVAEDPEGLTGYLSAMLGSPPTHQGDGAVSYRTARGEIVELLTPAKLQVNWRGVPRLREALCLWHRAGDRRRRSRGLPRHSLAQRRSLHRRRSPDGGPSRRRRRHDPRVRAGIARAKPMGSSLTARCAEAQLRPADRFSALRCLSLLVSLSRRRLTSGRR